MSTDKQHVPASFVKDFTIKNHYVQGKRPLILGGNHRRNWVILYKGKEIAELRTQKEVRAFISKMYSEYTLEQRWKSQQVKYSNLVSEYTEHAPMALLKDASILMNTMKN